MIKNKVLKISLISTLIFILSGCGGSSSDAPATEETQTGTFIDAKVQGLEYKTASFNGFTNENGNFNYYDGENVEFSLGGIKLGKIKAQSIITPIEVCEANSSTDLKVLNMLIFLQSLDSDNNTSNGITISNEVRYQAQNKSFDLINDIDINITNILKNDLYIDVNKIVSKDIALSHFTTTLSNEPLLNDYCDVGKTHGRINSIFTTYTNDCKQRKYRETYMNLAVPMFKMTGSILNAQTLSEIDISELKRDTISNILAAKQVVKYVKIMKATSAKGVTDAVIKDTIVDTTKIIGGVLAKSMSTSVADNGKMASIWSGVFASYYDAATGDITSVVTSQVDSLWKISSDLLASWKLNDLTEENNELQITQHVLEYYYSNLTDKSKLMSSLGLSGSFNWTKVVEKIATLKGYSNEILSEDYTTAKIVEQVTSYIDMIERVVDVDKYFIEETNYKNNLILGSIDNIGEFTNAKYIRIIPKIDTDNNNWEGLMCKIDTDNSFGTNCVLTNGSNIENFQNNKEYEFSLYPSINENWRGSAETHMTSNFKLISNIKDTIIDFYYSNEQIQYTIDDGISNTKVTFKDDDNVTTTPVPNTAWIRIVPRSYADADDYGAGINCKIQSDGSFENNCYIHSEYQAGLDTALANVNETYQVVVYKNHIEPNEKHWNCGENVYNYVGGSQSNWSNIEVLKSNFQDRSGEECHD
jgi:hypothetical protein